MASLPTARLTARGESAFTGLIVAGLLLSGVLVIAAVVGAVELLAVITNWLWMRP